MRVLSWLVSREVRRLRDELAVRRRTVSGQRVTIRRNQQTIRLQRKAIHDLTTSLARSEARRESAERQLREVDGE